MNSGVVLNTLEGGQAFLQKIRDEAGKGIIICEGRLASKSPIVLEIVDSKGKSVLSLSMNLSLSGVEQMFRHKNLVKVGGGPEPKTGTNDGEPDRLEQPLNYPDKECTGTDLVAGKNFVFVIGYNVNGKHARGWQSEMFKRMFWSSSKAKFWGVTWYGWDSQEFPGPFNLPFTRNYHINVEHAFKTVPEFQNFLLNTVEGEITIAAHSLGNMLVSAALSNYVAPTYGGGVWDASGKIKNYFMLDAAVASEAYGSLDNNIESEMNKDTVTNPNMIHPDWKDYKKELWASEWHLLFDTDKRSKLTWRNIFAERPTTVKYFNYFSSGEDVLDKHEGVPEVPDIVTEGIGRYAWALQEKLKGRTLFNGVLGSNYGGWGFNLSDDDYRIELSGVSLPIYPSEANQISSVQLRTRPFFSKGSDALLFTETGGSQYAIDNKIRLLADAFPARTLAAGKQPVPAFSDLNRDFDMQTKFKTRKKNIEYWPTVRSEKTDFSWKHNDIREVSYQYVFSLFDNIIDQGGLK